MTNRVKYDIIQIIPQGKFIKRRKIYLIRITKSEKEALENAGLIRYRKVKEGIEIQSPNIYVANREHLSRSKTYYVVEEPKIMKFLGLWVDKPRKNKNHNNKNKNYNPHKFNNNNQKREFNRNDK